MLPIKKAFWGKGKANIVKPKKITRSKKTLRGSHHKTRKLEKGMNSGKVNVRMK